MLQRGRPGGSLWLLISHWSGSGPLLAMRIICQILPPDLFLHAFQKGLCIPCIKRKWLENQFYRDRIFYTRCGGLISRKSTYQRYESETANVV